MSQLYFQTYVSFLAKVSPRLIEMLPRVRCSRVLASLCSPKTLMLRLGVFKIELGWCLPILLPSVMLRLSDYSPPLQLALNGKILLSWFQVHWSKISLNSFMSYQIWIYSFILLVLDSTHFNWKPLWHEILVNFFFENKSMINLAYLAASYESMAWSFLHLRISYCTMAFLCFDEIPHDIIQICFNELPIYF